MNRIIKCSLLSGLLGMLTSFLTVFILTFVTLSQKDPAPLARVCGYTAIILGAAAVGAVSAIKCKDNLIAPFTGSAFYIIIHLILYIVFFMFQDKSTLSDSTSFIQKTLLCTLVIFISFFISLLSRTRKAKKRSASSIRNTMAKNYKHLHRT